MNTCEAANWLTLILLGMIGTAGIAVMVGAAYVTKRFRQMMRDPGLGGLYTAAPTLPPTGSSIVRGVAEDMNA
jgi:hypothetical protein